MSTANGKRKRAPKPAPVTETVSLAFPGALALAGGDRTRVRVIDQTTCFTVNGAHLTGPPWPARKRVKP